VENVRFLEARNLGRADKMRLLARRGVTAGMTTQVKRTYDAELAAARLRVEETAKIRARVDIRCASLEQQLHETTLK